VRLLREPAFGDELARRGRELFLARYSWDAVGDAVAGAVHACLERSRR
jgi:hypothetical protein